MWQINFGFVSPVLLTCSISTFAQTKPETFTAKNAIYLYIGGNAGQYAFIYGRLISQKHAFK
jgi:hypothetical protein